MLLTLRLAFEVFGVWKEEAEPPDTEFLQVALQLVLPAGGVGLTMPPEDGVGTLNTSPADDLLPPGGVGTLKISPDNLGVCLGMTLLPIAT